MVARDSIPVLAGPARPGYRNCSAPRCGRSRQPGSARGGEEGSPEGEISSVLARGGGPLSGGWEHWGGRCWPPASQSSYPKFSCNLSAKDRKWFPGPEDMEFPGLVGVFQEEALRLKVFIFQGHCS